MAHIVLLAYPDCSSSGITGIIDALAMANLWQKTGRDKNSLFSWQIVSRDGGPVAGGSGVTITPHASLHGMKPPDAIILPGFLPPLGFIGKIPEETLSWVRRWYRKKVMVGTICTGTFFLAETGLLEGRTATTNWLFAGHFKKRYPGVDLRPEQMITRDNGLICTGASTAYLNLCLYLIEQFGSQALADRCAKSMLVERHRTSQSPYFVFDFQKTHRDEKILKAQDHMEKNFADAISLEELASDLGISSRHFKRRFKSATGDSPLAYLQRVRIEAAKNRLESTGEPVTQITWQVGYEDSNSFRRLFKKYTGLSPRAYRERFTRRAV